MGDKRKIDKKRLKELTDQAIPMSTFLSKIMGIRDKSIVGELTHKDLSFLLPELERTSYRKILDDPEMVYSGEVVLVIDSARNAVPYVVERKLQPLEEMGISDVIDATVWDDEMPREEIPNIRDYDLKSMSVYELEQLLAIYQSTHQTGHYEKVRRELVSRSDSKQGVRRSKQKALRKELKRTKIDEY